MRLEPALAEQRMMPSEQREVFSNIVLRYQARQESEDGYAAVRLRGHAVTGKSRILDEFLAVATLQASEPHVGTSCKVLETSPTGVLLDVYRCTWRHCRGIRVDTFDGAFDTFEQHDVTLFHVRQFDAWIKGECEC